jgi:hypothetical protein
VRQVGSYHGGKRVNILIQYDHLTSNPDCWDLYCTKCCGPKLWKEYLWNRHKLYTEVKMAIKREISYLRDKAASNGSPAMAKLAVPGEWERSYPALSEYMSLLVYPNGSPREASTVVLALEDGLLKGCVNDRTAEESLWRSAETLAGLLACLEEALRDPRASWRKWKMNFRTPGRK